MKRSKGNRLFNKNVSSGYEAGSTFFQRAAKGNRLFNKIDFSEYNNQQNHETTKNSGLFTKNHNYTVPNKQQNKTNPKSYFFQNLLIIVLITYVLVSYLTPKVTVDPVLPHSTNNNIVNTDNDSFINFYGKKAEESFYSAYNSFSKRNGQICDNYQNSLRNYANSLAAEQCTYTNCTKLIGYLAKDQVTGSTSANDCLNDMFQIDINNKLNVFINNMNRNMSDFQNEIQDISEQYAYEICTNMPSVSKLHFDKNQTFNTPDFKIALSNLGLSGAINTVALVIEAHTLISSGFFSSLRNYIVKIAWIAFKGPIKKAAASVAVSLADGPIPIGDIIGAIGLAWTVYDISCMREDFQNQVADSIYNRLSEEINNVRIQSNKAGRDIYSNYQKLRVNMEKQFKNEYRSSINNS